MKSAKSSNFSRLTQDQEDSARAVGARMAAQCLLDSVLPVWPGCIDAVDLLSLAPSGAKPATREAIIEQLTEAAGAGFFTCLDDNIPLQPETVLYIETDEWQAEIDFDTFHSVTPEIRKQMDPLICVLIDDAKQRYAWNTGKYLAAYAYLAGELETLRVFRPDLLTVH